MNSTVIKVLGFVATLGTMALSLVMDYVDDKKLDNKIDEKLDKRLNNQNDKEESC